MTNKEIIDSLVTKENFDKVVEICLKENIQITQQWSHVLPSLNIYHHKDGNKLRWSKIFSEDLWSFKTKDGKEFNHNNLNDFFIHYKDIVEFTKLDKISKTVFKVVPNIVGKNEHWYKDSGHYEISYNCHSFTESALTVYRYNNSVEYLHKSEYYVNGMLTDKKEWLMLSRENKLFRICGLKKEEKEKETHTAEYNYFSMTDYQDYA